MLSELYIITEGGSIAFVFDDEHRDLARATFAKAKASAVTGDDFKLNIVSAHGSQGLNGYTEQMMSMAGDVREYDLDEAHPWIPVPED